MTASPAPAAMSGDPNGKAQTEAQPGISGSSDSSFDPPPEKDDYESWGHEDTPDSSDRLFFAPPLEKYGFDREETYLKPRIADIAEVLRKRRLILLGGPLSLQARSGPFRCLGTVHISEDKAQPRPRGAGVVFSRTGQRQGTGGTDRRRGPSDRFRAA